MAAVSRRVGLNLTITGTNLTALNATTGVTVALWVRSGPGAGRAGDILRQSSTANTNRDGYRVGFNANGGFGIRVLGSAASADSYNSVAAISGHKQDRRWRHFCVSFDNSTNEVRIYRDGIMVAISNNATDMTSNASCTTMLYDTGIQGTLTGDLFDVQVLPDYVISPADVRLLMNPTRQHEAVRARWCGRQFIHTDVAGVVRDESGNGNHITVNANAAISTDEPPIFPTML